MEPLDLRSKPPRSCYAELDGLMLMPRTIDKMRAQLPGGDPGGYFINGLIQGLSGYLLERLGITEDDLRRTVAAAASEDDVAAWLRDHVDATQYSAINETIKRIKPKHAKDPEYFYGLYAATLAEHPELVHTIDIVDADDRRMFS